MPTPFKSQTLFGAARKIENGGSLTIQPLPRPKQAARWTKSFLKNLKVLETWSYSSTEKFPTDVFTLPSMSPRQALEEDLLLGKVLKKYGCSEIIWPT